jgi:hypothetical protein
MILHIIARLSPCCFFLPFVLSLVYEPIGTSFGGWYSLLLLGLRILTEKSRECRFRFVVGDDAVLVWVFERRSGGCCFTTVTKVGVEGRE